MYFWPLASQKYAPWARCTKRGVPPTARKARTGEFTPPGISALARSNSSWLRSVMVGRDSMSGGVQRKIIDVERAVGGGVSRLAFALFVVFVGPEQTIGHGVAHAGLEARVQALIEVGQRLGAGRLQVGPPGDQGTQRGGQGVASTTERGFKAFVAGRGQHRFR